MFAFQILFVSLHSQLGNELRYTLLYIIKKTIKKSEWKLRTNL